MSSFFLYGKFEKKKKRSMIYNKNKGLFNFR